MSLSPRTSLLCTLLLWGCATNPAPEVGAGAGEGAGETFVVRYREGQGFAEIVDTSIDVVWKALPQVFARLGYAGGASTSGKYTFLTPHLTVKGQLYAGTPTSTYIDCGRAAVGAQAADVYSVTFAILTRLSAKSLNETSVDVLIDGRALQQGARSYFVPCTGTGKLEREVIQAVVAQTVPHSRTARRPR